MAWSNGYYYRSRRRGRRVDRDYLGRGPEASLAAALVEERQRQRQAKRQQRVEAQQVWEAASAPLEELLQEVDLLVRAVLLINGWHQHARGQWRRRRHHG